VPFTIKTVEGENFISLPLHHSESKQFVEIVGELVYCFRMAGYHIVISGECPTPLIKQIELLHETMMGVFTLLRQEIIQPMKNIPKGYRVGWNFALWYTFNKVAQLDSENSYITIDRQVSLSPDGVWTKGAQYTDLIKIEGILRRLCGHFDHKLGEPAKFLKSIQHFAKNLIGKKPKKGCYTEDELTEITNDWVNRNEELVDKYTATFSDWSQIRINGLGHCINLVTPKSSKLIKQIQGTMNNRISDLIVKTRKGKKTDTAIASGNDLFEKLRVISGGNGIRTSAKVLWSPLFKCTQSEYINYVLAYSKYKYTTADNPVRDPRNYYYEIYDVNHTDSLPPTALNSVDGAAALYSELIANNLDLPAWKNFFHA